MLRSLALLLMLLCAPAAIAAEPVFPKGAAVGLVPPAGLAPASGFSGFQDPATNASIVIVELPVEAYAQIAQQLTPDALKAQGFVAEGGVSDWPLAGAQARIMRGTQTVRGLSFAKWVVLAGSPSATAMVTAQVPQTAADKVPAEAVETALRSIVFRAPVGLDDQLAALPFAIGDKAGMRVVRVIAGSGLYLTEGPLDVVKDASQPMVIVAASLGQAPPPEARSAFARRALGSVTQISDLKITDESQDKAGPVDWQRLEGTGTDSATGAAMRVTQIVRFESSGYVRIIGLARDSDPGIAERTRRLAASITLR